MKNAVLTSEAAAIQRGAMEAETILKNGANPKSQMSRRNFLVALCGALFAVGILFSGCSVPEDEEKVVEEKVVDPKFVGKWEVKTLTLENGTQVTLPLGSVSMGFEFTKDTYKSYANGEVVQGLSGVYTKGNRLHQSETLYLSNMSYEASGNVLTVVNSSPDNPATMVCDKVEKFSWEE